MQLIVVIISCLYSMDNVKAFEDKSMKKRPIAGRFFALVWQSCDEGAGCQAGEAAGEKSCEQEGREVPEHVDGAKDEGCHGELSDVVADGTYHAEQPEMAEWDMAVEEGAHCQAEKAAGKAEEQHEHLSGKETAQKNTHQEHQEGVFDAKGIERNKCDDVGKPKLDTGNGGEWRNLRFHQKEHEGDGG